MSSNTTEHDDIGDLIRQTILELGGERPASVEAANERAEATRTAIRAKILDFQRARSRTTASDRAATDTEIATRIELSAVHDYVREEIATKAEFLTALKALMPVVMLCVPLTDADLADDPEAVATHQTLLSVLEAGDSSTVGSLIDWASLKRVEQSFPRYKEIWEWSRRRLVKALPAKSSSLSLVSALGGHAATLKVMLDVNTDVQKYQAHSVEMLDKMTEYELEGRDDVPLADRFVNACAQRLLDLKDFTMSQGESSIVRSIFGSKANEYSGVSAFKAAAKLCQAAARPEIKELASNTTGELIGDTSWITKQMRKVVDKHMKSLTSQQADVKKLTDNLLTMALMKEVLKTTRDQPHALRNYRARLVAFSLGQNRAPSMPQTISMLSKSELQSQRAAVENGMATDIGNYLDLLRLTQEVTQMVSNL